MMPSTGTTAVCRTATVRTTMLSPTISARGCRSGFSTGVAGRVDSVSTTPGSPIVSSPSVLSIMSLGQEAPPIDGGLLSSSTRLGPGCSPPGPRWPHRAIARPAWRPRWDRLATSQVRLGASIAVLYRERTVPGNRIVCGSTRTGPTRNDGARRVSASVVQSRSRAIDLQGTSPLETCSECPGSISRVSRTVWPGRTVAVGSGTTYGELIGLVCPLESKALTSSTGPR